MVSEQNSGMSDCYLKGLIDFLMKSWLSFQKKDFYCIFVIFQANFFKPEY